MHVRTPICIFTASHMLIYGYLYACVHHHICIPTCTNTNSQIYAYVDTHTYASIHTRTPKHIITNAYKQTCTHISITTQTNVTSRLNLYVYLAYNKLKYNITFNISLTGEKQSRKHNENVKMATYTHIQTHTERQQSHHHPEPPNAITLCIIDKNWVS